MNLKQSYFSSFISYNKMDKNYILHLFILHHEPYQMTLLATNKEKKDYCC